MSHAIYKLSPEEELKREVRGLEFQELKDIIEGRLGGVVVWDDTWDDLVEQVCDGIDDGDINYISL